MPHRCVSLFPNQFVHALFKMEVSEWFAILSHKPLHEVQLPFEWWQQFAKLQLKCIQK